MFLFEEIPVSESEVQDWLDTVPNLSASTFRREAYRKAYKVEDKIRAVKRLHAAVMPFVPETSRKIQPARLSFTKRQKRLGKGENGEPFE